MNLLSVINYCCLSRVLLVLSIYTIVRTETSVTVTISRLVMLMAHVSEFFNEHYVMQIA